MRRFSQVPPDMSAPPQAPAMPPPPMGMPPMGAPAAAPGPADPNAGPRQELVGPLDSVSKILYDYDIGTVVDGNAARDAEELALEVWKAYGGNEMGDDVETQTGRRTDSVLKLKPEQQESEREATENKRWLRLPLGKTIEDITTLDELSEILSGLVLGSVKSKNAPPAPGGMPPPMASAFAVLHRYASLADSMGSHDIADALDDIISHSF